MKGGSAGQQAEALSSVDTFRHLDGDGFVEVTGAFQLGSKPLWWQPAFLGMFCDHYTEPGPLEKQPQGGIKLQMMHRHAGHRLAKSSTEILRHHTFIDY
eukprot:scaffold280995_cov37-Prasinocladus_malaysianus.AAC.1